MSNINFADDWIQTTDLWYQKQPLYPMNLNLNHFPEHQKLRQKLKEMDRTEQNREA